MTSSTLHLDLTGLEPPEPMRRALEAVEALGASDILEIVTDREPLLLQRELVRRGHRYVTGGSGQTITTTIRRNGGAMTTASDIRDALKQVLDPELGYNVVDLGLIYDVDIDQDLARILLTTTTKGCPATSFIREAVEERAAAVPGIAKVEVTMTWDPPWQPERMSDEAKAHFGFAGRTAAKMEGASR